MLLLMSVMTSLVPALHSGGSPGAGAVTQETLSDRTILTRQERGDSSPDESLVGYLETHTLVFVGGFLNEIARFPMAGNYFRQNVRTLRRADEAARVYKVFPPSSRRTDENVAFLMERLPVAYEKGGRRPLTIIGHSKGGAEALLTVLRNPDLILSGMVDDVVLVQAAIGGSLLADRLVDPRSDHPPPALLRVAGHLIRARYREGLLSKRTAEARRLFETALAEAVGRLDAGSFARMSGHVFYVRSRQGPEKMSRRAGLIARYLGSLSHDLNDGILTLGAQKLDGVGSDLGNVLSAAHTDLVCSGIGVTRKGRRYREAFTLQMLQALAAGRRPGGS
jgi:pimeloyl-ACP methyl ester carboxylesterase